MLYNYKSIPPYLSTLFFFFTNPDLYFLFIRHSNQLLLFSDVSIRLKTRTTEFGQRIQKRKVHTLAAPGLHLATPTDQLLHLG